MFMKTKKFLSIMLAVLMLTSLASLCVCAESEPIAKVVEFLNAPSQYTNGAAYGMDAEGTLSGKMVSLGNFGGYVIYEFNEPVKNSDNHAYGVDFIVSGNAFNAALTTQEPGQVWVSQDGKSWYALAGSEHYEDETVWDYSLTYQKYEAKKCTFTDSLGDSGTVSPAAYPLAENYPTVNIPEDNLTLSGVLLRKQRTASTSNGIQTSFGYTDALKKSSSSAPCNPYKENPVNNCFDGQFDISWAVDKNGFGVQLDSVKYIKVQTATFIDGAMFGEKSTEVSAIMRADEAESGFKKTSVPQSITVDGKEIQLESGRDYYETSVDGEFDVEVKTDANVYINNAYGTSRHFDSETDKGIIRVIVQSDDCLPLIYYINTGKGKAKTEITLSDTEKEIELGKTSIISAYTNNGEEVTFSSSDESIITVDRNGKITSKAVGEAYVIAAAESGRSEKCKVTVVEPAEAVTATVTFSVSGGINPVQKHEITVSSDEAEKYGFEVADKDHNGVKVDGVTVFDVIAAAHMELYGDAFAQNPDKYLIMGSSFITKAFSQNAASTGFIVNGVMPNDGIYNPDFYGCTGYACDTATVKDGDDISYFFYQDTKFWSDYYSWFDCDEYTVNAGDTLTVNLNGYCAMYYGINEWQTILDNYAEPLGGINVYAYIGGEKVLLGTADKNGNADISFPTEGEYIIFAEGVTKDESPIIVPYAGVSVAPQQNVMPDTFCGWVKYIWNTIINRFIKFFDFHFGWICGKG